MLGFILVMAPLVFMINGVTKGNWLETQLFAVAVAVGLTPEMLPMIVTVNLAKGAMAMSRKKVIVKRLNAIQNFGAMDVLCTGKTGTLTQDLIILKRHLDIRGADSDAVLEYANLNSYYLSGLKNLLDVAVLKHGGLEGGLKVRERFKEIDERGGECPSFSGATTGFISSSVKVPSKKSSQCAGATRSATRRVSSMRAISPPRRKRRQSSTRTDFG